MGNHILIVDDNTNNIQVLGNILRENEYEIAIALSGQEALEWVDSEDFDLVLLDIMMPEMDGYEVCQRIKKIDKHKDIPIIFLTAKTDTDSIVNGLEYGAVDYITKPFNSSELLARVKTHLDLKNARDSLAFANSQLEKEKEKSDKLLTNILNERIVKELKETGKTQPKSYDNVTLFFSDLVNFTPISETLEPTTLINELNDMFSEFDKIFRKHHCERMETIGDAYIAACGIPEANPKHAENIAHAAIEILDYMQSRSNSININWAIRIGIHSGTVAEGIVGTRRFAYNIFGDTVNTASRMETNSDPMKINVSEVSYRLIHDKFNFIERKPIEVKGKGEIKMYFLDTE